MTATKKAPARKRRSKADLERIAEFRELHPDTALTDDQIIGFTAWRQANPRPTIDHEAFGIVWQVPADLSIDLHMWLRELDEEGRTLDELAGSEALRFVVGVVGEEVLTQWRDLGVGAEAIAVEAGAIFAEINRRAAVKAAERAARDEE